jgi:uncharacterized SAM-binding protein YcdF (DUF218 family)
MKKLLIILGIIIILLYFSFPFILEGMAGFLIASDPLEKADVIVVLAGDANGERVEEGVKLYKEGWASKILLSGGPLAWHLTYAKNMRQEAHALGVPDAAVLLQDQSRSTYEDAQYSLAILKKLNLKRIILVTSPNHMRRARAVFRKMARKYDMKIMAHPVQKSIFNPKHFWSRHEDTQAVVSEYTALFGYLLKGWLF